MSATFGGVNIFGVAVRVQHVPRADASQTNAFFGISGTQMLYGGSRGRAFMISGMLTGDSIATLNAAEATLLSYADGIARDLVDPRGRTWNSVVFRGEYQPDANGPQTLAGGAGWCIGYKLTMAGLV